MKIQYMSDLHMEFAENSRYLKNAGFPVTGDVLVLAGDTFYLNNTTAPLAKCWTWGICQLQTGTARSRQSRILQNV